MDQGADRSDELLDLFVRALGLADDLDQNVFVDQTVGDGGRGGIVKELAPFFEGQIGCDRPPMGHLLSRRVLTFPTNSANRRRMASTETVEPTSLGGKAHLRPLPPHTASFKPSSASIPKQSSKASQVRRLDLSVKPRCAHRWVDVSDHRSTVP
jgi:hypothetical protein